MQPRELTVGMRLKITGNSNSHHFPIGEIVEVKEEPEFGCSAFRCGHPVYGTWWVRWENVEEEWYKKKRGYAKFIKRIEERRSA